ncbi:MAG: hypothetical protein IKW02_03645 [Clostridia bacterium]|nr:hypothetical protein [Clostridia bacterium]
MKKLSLVMLVALILSMFTAFQAFAAPAELSAVPESNGMLYIDIYNPETVVSTTTQKDYVLSGVAKSGVIVSVYMYDKAAAKYKLVTNGDVQAVQTIGASGYFAQRVSLAEGKNDILVRVDDAVDSAVASQVVRLEINLLVDSFWNKIKSASSNMMQELKNSFR